MDGEEFIPVNLVQSSFGDVDFLIDGGLKRKLLRINGVIGIVSWITDK